MDLKQLPEEFKEFLKSLQLNDVRYLLVGGWALGVYAEPRYTGDIDFFVAVDSTNLSRLQRALTHFGAPPLNEEEFRIKGNAYCIGRRPLRIELINNAAGIDFDDCWQRRHLVDVGEGLTVDTISKEDLLRNKQSAGRPKDLADVATLRSHSAHKSLDR